MRFRSVVAFLFIFALVVVIVALTLQRVGLFARRPPATPLLEFDVLSTTTTAQAYAPPVVAQAGVTPGGYPLPPQGTTTPHTYALPTAQVAAVQAQATTGPVLIEGLAPGSALPVKTDVGDTRGLAVSARFFYIASIDLASRSANLIQVRRDTYAPSQLRTLQQGGAFRIGGIHFSGGTLWASLSQESGAGPSRILALDPRYLDTRSSFEVLDGIGAIAQGEDGHLYGVNCTSSTFYEWTSEGQLVRQVTNATGGLYYDIEIIRGNLVLSGEDASRTYGVLDVIDPATFTLLVRHRSDYRTPQQHWLTNAGFGYNEGSFFFLPDDGANPTLWTLGLNGITLEQYIPIAAMP